MSPLSCQPAHALWIFVFLACAAPSARIIDANGMYTAPATVPNPATVSVSAVSQAVVTIPAPTQSGTYTITVTATAGSVSQNTSASLVVQ